MANSVKAAGRASITINERETEARLVFIPDAGGGEWDAAAVSALAAEKQLGPCSDQKALEIFLLKAAKAETPDPMEFIYIRGFEPEEAQGEKIKWEALPVPGDMAPFREETLKKAGAPEIIQVKVEKIKHEKTVKKSGALPFMAGKEEIAVTWEKKETWEKVRVNPAVREVKYADQNAKLGNISPSVPGKPGKSVFGRPIPPETAADASFHFGKGISRERNDFHALVSGFVRVGENWADIVPMAKHSWKINTGLDGLTFFLRFEPGDPRFALPKGEEILADAVSKGAAETALVSAKEINEAVAEAARAGEPLEVFSLFRVQEASARVDINDDKTRAVLYLRKGVAGALPLEMKAVSQAIKDSRVHGFDTEKLKADIRAFMQGKELELRDYVLAEGKASTRGKDRGIKLVVSPLAGEEETAIRARVRDWINRSALREEEVDPEKATGFAFIEKNAAAAEVTEGSAGEEGKDIFGNDIPALPGNDPDIRLFEGLELRGSAITASKSGLLVQEASDKSYRGKVLDYRDAKIGIHITEDGMEASADLFREEGAGIPLTVDNVKKVLAVLGIKKGIDWEEVEKACEAARGGASVLGRVIARGKAPVAKGGSALKWLVQLSPAELPQTEDAELPIPEPDFPVADEEDPEPVFPAPEEETPMPTEETPAPEEETPTPEEEAPMPTEEVSAPGEEAPVPEEAPAPPEPAAGAVPGKTAQIKAGDPIAELSEPSVEGRPGYDVRGNEIPAGEVSDPVPEYDDSIREEPSGSGKRLIAIRSGELSFDGKTLKITSLKIIQGDVSPAAGDVKFSGEIQIGGNVLRGARIMGGSNIIVNGLAEEALIIAGGKVVAALGFKGGDRGIIRAREGLVSAFVERASVLAVGDIELKRGSIRSSIKTNGKVLVASEAGKLSGGVCQARQGVDAANVGSEKGLRTEISFGQDYWLKDAINACEEELAGIRQNISLLDEKLKNHLDKKQPLPENLKHEKIKFIKLQDQLKLKLFTLREKFEEHSESEIKIRGTVFPGVVIESHNRYYEVKQKRSRVFFYFDHESGRIREKPMT